MTIKNVVNDENNIILIVIRFIEFKIPILDTHGKVYLKLVNLSKSSKKGHITIIPYKYILKE